jgi:hypothetical protein
VGKCKAVSLPDKLIRLSHRSADVRPDAILDKSLHDGGRSLHIGERIARNSVGFCDAVGGPLLLEHITLDRLKLPDLDFVRGVKVYLGQANPLYFARCPGVDVNEIHALPPSGEHLVWHALFAV